MAYLDETGLSTLRTRMEAVYKRRDHMIGMLLWWTGTTDNIPANAKICNGQAISRTTYSKLFSIIGTSYGSGDGSTTFALPDLRVSYDNYGRFIRARFSNTVNNKQDDAIRNIIGYLAGYRSRAFPAQSGAFYVSSPYGPTDYQDIGSNFLVYPINLSANGGNTSDNPMAGHATATASNGGIRPYNISMIPIIIVS